jgi:hypothetical protein
LSAPGLDAGRRRLFRAVVKAGAETDRPSGFAALASRVASPGYEARAPAGARAELALVEDVSGDSSRHTRVGAYMRRLVLGALRPYREHQAKLDRAILDTIREGDEDAARSLRELDERLALLERHVGNS